MYLYLYTCVFVYIYGMYYLCIVVTFLLPFLLSSHRFSSSCISCFFLFFFRWWGISLTYTSTNVETQFNDAFMVPMWIHHHTHKQYIIYNVSKPSFFCQINSYIYLFQCILCSVFRPAFVCFYIKWYFKCERWFGLAQVSGLQKKRNETKRRRREKRSDMLIIIFFFFLFLFQLFSYCIHKIPLAWTPLLR